MEFQESLFDDLNTPKSLSILNVLIDKLKESNKKKQSKIYTAIIEAMKLLGIGKNKEIIIENFDLIKKLIDERDRARQKKDFDRADEIRLELSKINVEIEDTKEGTKWKKLK